MTRIPLGPLAGILLSLPLTLLADTIFLSNGEKVDGKVLSNTDASVEVEVSVSSGIRDVRTIPKGDILRIEKPDPALLAYASIKTIRPGANSLTAPEYDQVLARLQTYLTSYPLSAQTPSVQEVFDAFKTEQQRVKNGEVKINQRWLSADEAGKNQLQIGALLALQKMQATAVAGDEIGALNQFTALEKNFKGARAYPDAVLLAKSLFPRVQQDLDAKTLLLARDMAERAQGLALTPDYRRPELIAAAQKEETETNSQLDAAKRSGMLWNPIYPRSKRSLDDLAKVLDTESKRLEGLKLNDFYASLKAAEEGQALIEKKEFKAAEAPLADAARLWPDNALVKTSQAALAEAAKITPTPVPTATPVATPKKAAPATPAVARTPLPTPAPEPKKPFLLSTTGIILIVVLVAAIAIFSMLAKPRRKGDIQI